MKAWKVTDGYGYGEGSTVVFAETRGKAKVIALTTDACEDSDFISVSVRRFPEMDKEYRGSCEINWDDMKDRLALVKLGWECYEPDYDECEKCDVRDYCDHWEYLQDEEDDDE